mmetsp:Transcript_66677/g.144815  ORF Transcript_66677/g.144815 Transcript_66677/m.144815 type:complete len:510 (+) Transcript_66677:2841-4370(+)
MQGRLHLQQQQQQQHSLASHPHMSHTSLLAHNSQTTSFQQQNCHVLQQNVQPLQPSWQQPQPTPFPQQQQQQQHPQQQLQQQQLLQHQQQHPLQQLQQLQQPQQQPQQPDNHNHNNNNKPPASISASPAWPDAQQHPLVQARLQQALAQWHDSRIFATAATSAPPLEPCWREGRLQDVTHVDGGCFGVKFDTGSGRTSLAEYWASHGWSEYRDRGYAEKVHQAMVRHGPSSVLTYPADKVYRLAAPISLDDKVAPSLTVNPRRLLVAEKGHVLLSVDYSQLEVRIMAHFSQDERFVQILHGEGDVFRHVAANWLRKKESSVSAEERSGAKRICYGLIYGIGAGRLSTELGISKAQAAEFQESFMREFSGIAAWIQVCRDAARRNGYIETLHNRRRFLPALSARARTDRSHAERQAVNSTCQASAADLVKAAMLAIHSQLKRLRVREGTSCRMAARMILQLHDELVFEVREECIDTVRELVVSEMIAAGRDLRVPLQVKWRVGKTFGTLE